MSFSAAAVGRPAEVTAQLRAHHLDDPLGVALRDAIAAAFDRAEAVVRDINGFEHRFVVSISGHGQGSPYLNASISSHYVPKDPA